MGSYNLIIQIRQAKSDGVLECGGGLSGKGLVISYWKVEKFAH
jgi:hypothetical protein